jgi:hypothetical protein
LLVGPLEAEAGGTVSGDWRLALSLVTLFAEINTAHPNRPKAADGSIAGAAHHARNPGSDHEPNADGVVTAIDITTADFTDDLAEDLRLMGKQGDGRVKYVIYKHRFTSAKHGWQWVPYGVPGGVNPTGDPHENHIHLSVSADPKQYDRRDSWQPQQAARDDVKPQPLPEDDVTPADIEAVAQRAAALIRKDLAVLLHGTRDGSHPANLDNLYADTQALRKQAGA